MSDSSEDESYTHASMVTDWESLLTVPSEEDTKKSEISKESMKNVRKMYRNKVLKVNEVANELMEESLSADALAIRQKLAEKWSDLKGVSAKNIKLLHEQNPEGHDEIVKFFSSTLKLLSDKEEESKNFGHFLTSFATSCTKMLLHCSEEEKGLKMVNDTVIASIQHRASEIKEISENNPVKAETSNNPKAETIQEPQKNAYRDEEDFM